MLYCLPRTTNTVAIRNGHINAIGVNCFLFVLFCAFSWPFQTSLNAQEPPAESAPAPDLITNPAVRAALEAPRREPLDYVWAILTLVDLGQAERARPIVEELVQQQISDAQRAEIVEQLGSAAMLRLARDETIGPAAREFVETTMAAAASAATSPERLEQLVQQLGATSPDDRRAAAVELASTGIAGVKYVVAALAATQDETQRAGLRQALVGLAPLSVPPLFAVMESGDDQLRANAIAVLAEIGGGNVAPLVAVPALLEPADSIVGQTARQAYQRLTGEYADPTQAEQIIRRAIKNYLAGTPPFRPDADGLVEMWAWNSDQKQLDSSRMTIPDAALVRASRLADGLAQLKPGDREAERQSLMLGLEANWVTGQGATTRQIDLTQIDPMQLNEALRESLDDHRFGTAIAVAAELGRRGDTAVLFTPDGKPSPLAAALDSPHPQVRFAALSAIMQLDLKTPFAGSSRVAEALTRMAQATGSRRAVVAMPPIERAASLAGELTALQLDAVPVELGRDAVAQAVLAPDVELVLVDMAIDRPGAREVLFQLRRTPATALVPIGLLAGDGRLAEAQQIAREHLSVRAFSRPHSPETNAAIVEKLALDLPRGWPTAEERAAQASQALEWIDRLLSDGRSFYNLRGRPEGIEAALVAPPVPTESNLKALAKVGTATSQRMLVNYVNQAVLPIESRQQAATAFAQAVDRYGLQLTTNEILKQYERYNASETADEATQQVLGAVLDTMESSRVRQDAAND